MKVNQIKDIINTVTHEVLGTDVVVEEDLSNIVTIGKQIQDLDKMDNYVRKLVDHIGKVVFKDRLYTGGAPSVLMDAWEYGSILEKVTADLPEASENASWELEGGQSYDPNVFYKPTVSAKFFNGKVTFEVPLSFTEKQVKSAFSSVEQLNGFLSMLTTAVENSITVKLDALIMRTINNATAETIAAEFADDKGALDLYKDSVKGVNLLKLYNARTGANISLEHSLTDPAFIRFATYTISMYGDRMSKISSLFNIEAKERFTPADQQKLVLLSDFAKAADTFLAASTYNAEMVALPNHETVPYWQGSGKQYAIGDVSRINVKTTGGHVVNVSGVIGVMFDRDALGVTNLDRRVTTNFNPRAEFYTNFYKFDAGYFNDHSENFVVFFIA